MSNEQDETLALCGKFVRAKRRLNVNGHERRYMFNVTCPFTCAEGMRFSLITNGPYDFLNYEPTTAHVFIEEPTLEAFENYVDEMFNDEIQDDFSYFKILKAISNSQFSNLVQNVNRGMFKNSSSDSNKKLPISIIPVIENQLLEDHSILYTVKSTSPPLERMYVRLKLNTYFVSLMKLLQCTEEDIINILYRKGVLPSRQFQLVSSQKALMISLKRFYSDTSLNDELKTKLRQLEINGNLIKPLWGNLNSNLVQALSFLFSTHPLYSKRLDSLLVKTKFMFGGKGYLSEVGVPMKRKCTGQHRDQSALPKKLIGDSNVSSQYETMENNILHQAMMECVPELYVEPNEDILTISIDRNLIKPGYMLCIRKDDSGELIVRQVVDN